MQRRFAFSYRLSIIFVLFLFAQPFFVFASYNETLFAQTLASVHDTVAHMIGATRQQFSAPFVSILATIQTLSGNSIAPEIVAQFVPGEMQFVIDKNILLQALREHGGAYLRDQNGIRVEYVRIVDGRIVLLSGASIDLDSATNIVEDDLVIAVYHPAFSGSSRYKMTVDIIQDSSPWTMQSTEIISYRLNKGDLSVETTLGPSFQEQQKVFLTAMSSDASQSIVGISTSPLYFFNHLYFSFIETPNSAARKSVGALGPINEVMPEDECLSQRNIVSFFDFLLTRRDRCF